MKLLTQLANKYGSDKGSVHGSCHNFTEIYDDFFLPLRNQPITLLEIGINDGASLCMWREYFPFAQIIGLDIANNEHRNADKISCYVVDQSDDLNLIAFAERMKELPDIIIDGGKIGGHDINTAGVSQAVQEVFFGKNINRFADTSWLVNI